MVFEILGEIRGVQTIAKGTGVKSRFALRKKYGAGNWRKMKGFARVKLADESEHQAEVHWYEAHGIGKRDFKIKRLLD